MKRTFVHQLAGWALAACLAPASAQTGTAAGAEPDLVDLKLGMTPKQSADVLARRYPGAIRKTVKGRWETPVKAEFVAGLLAIEARQTEQKQIVDGEYVQLAFATPPNEPAVVGIQRKLLFGPGHEPHRDEWVKSLETKYGPATLRQDHRGNDVARSGQPVAQLVWYFDKARADDPKGAAGPLARRCESANNVALGEKWERQFDERLLAELAEGRRTGAYTGWMRTALDQEARAGFCGRSLRVTLQARQDRGSMSGLRASLGSPLLGAVEMHLSDHDGAAAAARKSGALVAGAADKAAAEKVEQSRKNKPTL